MKILEKRILVFCVLAVWILPPVAAELRMPVSSLSLEAPAYKHLSHINDAVLQAKVRTLRMAYGAELSFQELNTIADDLTYFIRDQGYKFHRVFIRPQGSEKGEIVLALSVTRLQDLQIDNASPVADASIRRYFSAYLGEDLYQPDIDQALLALKSSGGLSVFAFYSRADNVKNVRLNLRVRERSSLAWLMRADNFGSESSGQNRALISYANRSSVRDFDSLNLGFMYGHAEEALSYAFFSYKFPLINLQHSFSISYADNQFGLGDEFASLELAGKARVATTDYEYTFSRSRYHNQSVVFGLAQKDTDMSSIFNSALIEQDEESKNVWLRWQGAKQMRRFAGGVHGGISVSAGQFNNSEQSQEESHFKKLAADLKFYTRAGKGQAVWWLRGQHSNEALPAVERMSLGGAYAVRAIAPGQYSADRGMIASTEWRSAAWEMSTWKIEPYIFLDAAYGEKLGARTRETFSGIGVGCAFYWQSNVQLTLQAADLTSTSQQFEQAKTPLLLEMQVRW